MADSEGGTDSSSSAPTRFSFSTEDIPAAHRMNAFRDAIGALVDADWRARSPVDFSCRLRADLFEGVTAADFHTSEVRGGPNARQASYGDDRIVIQICDHGSFQVEQRASAFAVSAGHAAIVRNDLEGHVDFSNDTRLQCLLVDSDLVRPLLKSAWSRTARPVSAETPALRLLRSWLASRTNVELSSDPALRALYARHTADLVAMILGPHSDAQPLLEGRGIRAARLKAIINAITQNATRPDLSADKLGRSLDISERYVRLLLEETGMTFSEHVLEERLQHARRLLHAPHLAGRSIAEIAMMAGFSDISHFNRSFRRRFGATPRDVRADRG